MDQTLIDIIVKVGVGLLVALITGVVIPAVTSWYSNLKDSKLKDFIKTCVDAAEQIYGAGTADTKKAYVINKIKSVKAFSKVSDETLDTLIEAAVMPISAAIKQAKEVAAASVSTVISAEDLKTISETATSIQKANGLTVAKNETKVIADRDNSSSDIKLS